MSVNKIRAYIKKALVSDTEFTGHMKERTLILDLLQKTIECGESNSALLIGPRGSGKTTLIESVLRQLETDKNFKKNAILVRLNGFVHVDDRLALKSITSQMELENVVDGKVFGSFAENLSYLLMSLKSGQKETSRSVVFILEEFDLFCSHHKQTLLYNLFDISQSAQAPICVIGLTCRLDVIELLEKRVKSRFSHRQIFLFCGSENSDTDDTTYGLKRIEYYLKIPNDVSLKINQAHIKQWNKTIDELLGDKKFKGIMKNFFFADKTEGALKDFLFTVVCQLSEESSKLTIEMFNNEMKMFQSDDLVQVLQDLSVLELCLIISMKHHAEIYDNQPMNFEMALTRYVKFVHSHKNAFLTERAVIMKAFENIQKLELISMLQTSSSRIQKEYQLFSLLVTPQQIVEAVNKVSFLPIDIKQWAVSSLV